MDALKTFLVSAAFVNWKTTLVGFLGAAGLAGAAYLQNQPGAWPYVASFVILLVGLLAKDHNVTGGTVQAKTGTQVATEMDKAGP